jgi:hypothetical protein
MSFKQRIISTTALVASVVALTAPSATAMPRYPVGPHQPYAQSTTQPAAGKLPAATYSRQDKQVVTATPSAPTSVAPVKTPASGFTLGDAGIGLGALALAMLVLAGGLAFSRSRSRRTHGQAALTH